MMPVRRSQNWLPDVFNDLFDTNWMSRSNATAPAINVIETENEYKVEVAAPGMTKEDFSIKIDDENQLVVAMEKKLESKEENKNSRYLRREFSYTKFQQTMLLPDNVLKDKIGASMDNGVLTINIPKMSPEEEKKYARLIEIK
ncbi:Hsp20/alpha crystallin family protein [Bacteroides sedimenti]|uniref:Heat-shock protein n=1 Tax=Bacteroides sedimenti TaxID=2136147 RepID=A0ABN6Z7U3_9BACE